MTDTIFSPTEKSYIGRAEIFNLFSFYFSWTEYLEESELCKGQYDVVMPLPLMVATEEA